MTSGGVTMTNEDELINSYRSEIPGEPGPHGVTAPKSYARLSENGWIDKVLRTEAKRGKEAAIERGRGIAMSLSLGREFGETMEAFEQRKPEVGEFYRWWKQYA